MAELDLQELSTQLDSTNSRDRLLALVALKDVAAEDAVPLIRKVLDDDNLQVRGMAVFALGLKPTDECLELLLELLMDDDYSIRAAAEIGRASCRERV